MQPLLTIEATNELCPQLPKNSVDIPLVVEGISGMLFRAGLTRSDILSRYSDEPVVWPIPSLYGTLQGDFVGFKSATLKTGGDYRRFFNNMKRLVAARGLNHMTRPTLVGFLGPVASHPLLLSDVPATKEGLNTFCAQLATLMTGTRGSFVIGDDRCYFSYGPQKIVRLPLGLTPEMGASKEDIEQAVMVSQGFVTYGDFNILDRCLLSTEALVPYLRVEVVRALAVMKLTRNPLIAARLEDYIYKAEAFEPLFTAAEAEVMFLDDSLHMIRDLWLESKKSAEGAFQDLFNYLVPDYLDGDEFYKMFKHLPKYSMRFDTKSIDSINKGLGYFEGWFLQMQRVVREGKLRFRG